MNVSSLGSLDRAHAGTRHTGGHRVASAPVGGNDGSGGRAAPFRHLITGLGLPGGGSRPQERMVRGDGRWTRAHARRRRQVEIIATGQGGVMVAMTARAPGDHGQSGFGRRCRFPSTAGRCFRRDGGRTAGGPAAGVPLGAAARAAADGRTGAPEQISHRAGRRAQATAQIDQDRQRSADPALAARVHAPINLLRNMKNTAPIRHSPAHR